jgi:hypothetical protein
LFVNVPDAKPGDIVLRYGWINSPDDFGWDYDYTPYGGLTIATIAPTNEDGAQVVTWVDNDAMALWRVDYPQYAEDLWANPRYRFEIERADKAIVSVVVTYSDGTSVTLP